MVAVTGEARNSDSPERQAATVPRRGFGSLLAAAIASNLGDGVYQFGLPLLVVQLTGGPAAVALVTVMLTVGWPVFGLFAGHLVDGLDRRRLLVVVSAARVAILGGLTVGLVVGPPPLALIYVGAFLLGLGETLVDTATTAMVPAVVERARLGWANGRISAAQTATNSFVGPPLAGLLIGVAGWLVTAFGSLAMLAATLLIRRIPARSSAEAQTRPNDRVGVVERLTEGFRFQWRQPLLRRLTLFTAAMNVWWAAWVPLFVVLAVAPTPSGLGLAGYQYGLLLTAMAVGGVLGSLACSSLQRLIGLRLSLTLDLIGTAALVGVPAVTGHPVALGAAIFGAGFGASVWVVLVSSVRQALVPDRLLGRAYAASRLISWGVLPVGAALGGLAAELIGIRSLFGLGAIVSFGLLGWFLVSVTGRGLDEAMAAGPAGR